MTQIFRSVDNAKIQAIAFRVSVSCMFLWMYNVHLCVCRGAQPYFVVFFLWFFWNFVSLCVCARYAMNKNTSNHLWNWEKNNFQHYNLIDAVFVAAVAATAVVVIGIVVIAVRCRFFCCSDRRTMECCFIITSASNIQYTEYTIHLMPISCTFKSIATSPYWNFSRSLFLSLSLPSSSFARCVYKNFPSYIV